MRRSTGVPGDGLAAPATLPRVPVPPGRSPASANPSVRPTHEKTAPGVAARHGATDATWSRIVDRIIDRIIDRITTQLSGRYDQSCRSQRSSKYCHGGRSCANTVSPLFAADSFGRVLLIAIGVQFGSRTSRTRSRRAAQDLGSGPWDSVCSLVWPMRLGMTFPRRFCSRSRRSSGKVGAGPAGVSGDAPFSGDAPGQPAGHDVTDRDSWCRRQSLGAQSRRVLRRRQCTVPPCSVRWSVPRRRPTSLASEQLM